MSAASSPAEGRVGIARGLATWALCLLPAGCATTGAPTLGKPAASFSLPDRNGDPVSSAQLQGKVALIDFFASWCAPCREELPVLERLRQEYQAKGVAFIAIDVDVRGDREEALKMIEQVGVKMQVVFDAQQEVVKLYQPPTMPTSMLLDRGGLVSFVHEGYRDGDERKLRRELDELLAR